MAAPEEQSDSNALPKRSLIHPRPPPPRRLSASDDHLTSARLLLAYPDVVSELGGKANSWLEEADIDPDAPADHSVQIPLRSVGQLLEDTAARLGCPDLGMRLAERQSMQATMQPLDQLFWTAPTIRDAFEACIRYIAAFNSGIIMELEDDFIMELNDVPALVRNGSRAAKAPLGGIQRPQSQELSAGHLIEGMTCRSL